MQDSAPPKPVIMTGFASLNVLENVLLKSDHERNRCRLIKIRAIRGDIRILDKLNKIALWI